jgi:hypothetical protein
LLSGKRKRELPAKGKNGFPDFPIQQAQRLIVAASIHKPLDQH